MRVQRRVRLEGRPVGTRAPLHSQPRQHLLHDIVDAAAGRVEHVGVGRRVRGETGTGGVDAGPAGPRPSRRLVAAAPPGPLLASTRSGTPSASRRGTRPCRCPGPRRRRRRGRPPTRAGARPGARRTPGLAATAETARLTSGVRMASVTSCPSITTRRSHLEAGGRGHAGHGRLIGRVDPLVEDAPGHGPVHGPGVEPVEPEALGQCLGDGGLARAGRAVDGDERPAHGRSSAASVATAAPARALEVGEEGGVAGARPRRTRPPCSSPARPGPATVAAMARRWSPPLWKLPGRRAPERARAP